MSDPCPNCQKDMQGYEYCSNCGWRRETFLPEVQRGASWKTALGVYAAIAAALGACGTAIYIGASTIFGFGPFHDSLIVKVVAWVILGILAAGKLMRRFRR